MFTFVYMCEVRGQPCVFRESRTQTLSLGSLPGRLAHLRMEFCRFPPCKLSVRTRLFSVIGQVLFSWIFATYYLFSFLPFPGDICSLGSFLFIYFFKQCFLNRGIHCSSFVGEWHSNFLYRALTQNGCSSELLQQRGCLDSKPRWHFFPLRSPQPFALERPFQMKSLWLGILTFCHSRQVLLMLLELVPNYPNMLVSA